MDLSQVSRCCPDLQEIIITDAVLRPSELNLIHAMCNGSVTKLSITVHGMSCVDGSRDAAGLDALRKCFHTWSPTLRYLKIDVRKSHISCRKLEETIGILSELRELQITTWMNLDSTSISSLRYLERFACLTRVRGVEPQSLLNRLEDTESFPSLKHLIFDFGRKGEFADKIEDICERRNIQLQQYWPTIRVRTS